MSSFGEQFEDARQTNLAVRALEQAVRGKVTEVLGTWQALGLAPSAVRRQLETIVRDAYRSSAALAVAHISAQAGVPRWRPRTMAAETLSSSYLKWLLADTRRNLVAYMGSLQTPEDHRRAVSRIGHSAGVAAARGYTDALLRCANELQDLHGFILRKVWRANFVNHVPCELCADLDRTALPLEQAFEGDNRLKVFGDLQGPPRHPRCMCWLVILFEGLENWDEDLDSEEPRSAPVTMTTEQVKALRPGFFGRVVGWLRTFVRSLRRTR